MSTDVAVADVTDVLVKTVGGRRAGSGRKKHVPTQIQRDQVKTLSGYGITLPQIASLIGVSVDTISARYTDELMLGRATADSQVVQSLFARATKDKDTTAMIWWTKARMGWSEKATLGDAGVFNIHVHL